MPSNFIHLHVHSHYSLLDGLPQIPDLVKIVQKYEMPAVALTDHGTMYGIIEFYQKATKAGIKPILGVETYVARRSHTQKETKEDIKPYHLVLLAYNNQGYQNLLKLISIAHLEGYYYKPRIDWELLEKYHGGLIALSSCLAGPVSRSFVEGNEAQAEKFALRLNEIMGPNNFYIELQHHPSIPDFATTNEKLIKLATKLNLPLVATNDVHYLTPDDAEAQDIMLCIQQKKKIDDTDRLSYLGEDFSFRSPEQMSEDFKNHPEAIANTLKIANRCNVKLDFGQVKLPHFEVPEGLTAEDYLQQLCDQGFSERYGDKKDWPEIAKRLEYEMSIIRQTGFAPYFLIVQDFVNWSKNHGIMVGPGRGSAAGSLVSYLIKITDADPIKYGLLFERFLNPERISMPDIDLDFADTRRDEVIQYVQEKYGHDHVAQIITFGTMAARVAVRDVGRVLNYSYDFCDQLAKMIPPMDSLDEALNQVPEVRNIYNEDPRAKRVIDVAKKLEGSNRHSSIHACGVLITKEPLDENVPIQYASSSDKTIVSQYSLHPIEDLGLLKMDFLGLRNLTIIENALDIIKKISGKEIDLDKLPLDDKKTYELLQRAETMGVFQLESSGMRRYLKELRPTEMDDIIAMVALYRPGPMEFIPDYIAGKNGKRVTYIHPKLQPILERTFGIAVYQEQVLEIARELAGFSYGEADVLRKAVGKKIESLLLEQGKKMIDGMIRNQISPDIAKRIWEFIIPFASYGFNKAHATCYALIAYQTAYLKANYPTEFMAALLTAEQNNMDNVTKNLSEAKNMKIKVLPPDINESYRTFTAVAKDGQTTNTIRFGLQAIKNLGEHIAGVIIAERRANGNYTSLVDFLSRIQDKDLNKKSLESLIKAGALDSFGERGQLLQNMNRLLSFNKTIVDAKNNQQVSLFSTSTTIKAPELKLEAIAPATTIEKLNWEKEFLGIYISSHPFEGELPKLTSAGGMTIAKLKEAGMEFEIKPIVGGVVGSVQKILTKSGERMYFVKIEDSSDDLEILVFPNLLKETFNLWEPGTMIVLTGKLSDKDGELKLITDSAKLFNEATLKDDIIKLKNFTLPERQWKKKNGDENDNGKGVQLNAPTEYAKPADVINLIITKPLTKDAAAKLKNIFDKYPGPKKVHLLFKEYGMIKKTLITKTSISFNPDVERELESILGRGSVEA